MAQIRIDDYGSVFPDGLKRDINFNKIEQVFQDWICDYFSKEVVDIDDFYISDLMDTYCSQISDLRVYDDDFYYGHFNYGHYFNIDFKGKTICDINMDYSKQTLTINNEIIYYEILNRNVFKKELYKILDRVIDNNKSLFCMSDFISDIEKESNDSWDFSYDINNGTIKITLSYLIPYFNEYTKRMYVSRLVNIPSDILDNIPLTEYKMKVTKILDEQFAPIMQQMLDEEIGKYNLKHISSVAYKSSEVRHDK
jgi:hypothetical protein